MNTPKTRLTEQEQHCFSLGVRMAAAGFTEADTPYAGRTQRDKHEAWMLGATKFRVFGKEQQKWNCQSNGYTGHRRPE